ncbi:MAG: glutamine amidotransferase, partial [Phycisphaerales bacterium]
MRDADGSLAREVSFGPGRAVELFQVRLDDRRVHRYEAVFEPEADAQGVPLRDRVAANNRAGAFTISPGRGAILLIDGVSDGEAQGAGRTLVGALGETGLDVRVVSPLEAPTDLLTLQNYDLVILENVAAEEIPAQTQRLLADFVTRSGGGLAMVGGPDSFGAGGWKGSALEPILPVTLDLPEQLIVPPAAMMIVLDSSGSMARGLLGGMRSQQAIANEGAARAILSLDEQDLVGVLEFNNFTNTVVPLGPNDDPSASAERVRRIVPGGGTNMYPALAEAGAKLAEVEAQVKHVIVLSDGMSQGAPSQGFQIAEDLRAQGVTVSTIAVGDGADTTTLSEIAELGGGTFYRVIDPNTLPRIFLRETRVVRKPLLREGRFDPVVLPVGSPITAGLPASTPPLFGYVLTQKRADPSVVYAIDSASGEPILAHWNAGLGRVAAFTSDAHDEWAREWLGWPGYAQMWTQLVRTTARPAASRGFDLATEIVGDTLTLRLDARDDENLPIDLLTVPAVVYNPDGTRTETTLAQTGPGLYEASLPARESGAYIVALTPRSGERALSPVLGGATRAVGPELRTLRSNVGLLREIAERTGGRVLDIEDPAAVGLFAREDLPPSRATLPMWRPLLALLVVVFLLDVATRRVAWDRWLSRESLADLREAAASAKASGAATATGTLMRAKRRTEEAEAQ